MTRTMVCVAAALLLGACGETAESAGRGGGGGAGGGGGGGAGGEVVSPPEPLVLAWQPCELEAGPQHRRPAECAEVEAPLDWSQPEGERIKLFVKRVPAEAPAGKSLWMLQGGPGGPGSTLEGVAWGVAEKNPGVTIYLPDHRGTGLSTRLGCAAEAADTPGGTAILAEEWLDCTADVHATWGSRLHHFRTTQAAEDLFQLVRAVEEDGEAPFVIGFSYGTYWANRYLQFHPDQAAGVIFDSMCAPGLCNIAEQDLWQDEVAQANFRVCAEHAVCGEKLGDDPWAKLGELHAALDEGHCPEARGLDGSTLRAMLGYLNTFVFLRELAPPLVYRALRCEPGDVEVLARFFTDEPQPNPTEVPGYSWVLGANVVLGELWESPAPSYEEVYARHLGTRVAQGAPLDIALVAPAWDRYEEPLALEMAETDVPMLMLSGSLDPQTPLHVQQPMADHFAGPRQRHVIVPRAAHAVLARSPLHGNPAEMCGIDLLTQFLAAPEAELDLACLEQVRVADYAYTPNVQHFFGTSDPWEN